MCQWSSASQLCHCRLRLDQGNLQLVDPQTSAVWLTAAEAAEKRAEHFRLLSEKERAARTQEDALRKQLEAENAELRAELERLRNQMKK